MKRYTEPMSSGPAKALRQASPDAEPMAVDVDPPSEVASAVRDLPDDALVRIHNLIRKKFGGRKLDNGTKGTDTTFQDVLLQVHHGIWTIEYFGGELLQSFLTRIEQVKINVFKKSASDFVDKLREAFNGNDHKLWGPVVIHGTFNDL